MGRNTAISWCHHTFNIWWGCSKVSPGCENCYAAALDKRIGGDNWKAKGPRRFFGDKHWRQPLAWNELAVAVGERHRVFCSSMADVFERHPDVGVDADQTAARFRLWNLIERTPNLDWLLLTKRPENIRRMIPETWKTSPRPNVWYGTTVEDQKRARGRLRSLAEVPAVVRFLSCEPLLECVDPVQAVGEPTEDDWESADLFDLDEEHHEEFIQAQELSGDWQDGDELVINPEHMEWRRARIYRAQMVTFGRLFKWLIAGCESGHHARPCQVEWLRYLRDLCLRCDVKFFLKQATDADVGMFSGDMLVKLGPGSKRKAGGVIELPYLDGIQHAAFPEVRHG